MKRHALLGVSVLFTSIAVALLLPVLGNGLAWLNDQIGNDGQRLVVAGLCLYVAGVARLVSKK